jgi:predicted nuclease of predicted toxin-antitoxin system
MSDEIQFYLDQHIPFAVTEGLRRRGVDTLTSQEAGRCGLPDSDQLGFATEHQRVMVTFDSDYLHLASSGSHHAGVVWCPSSKHTVGQLISALVLIHSVLTPEEMQDHVEFL